MAFDPSIHFRFSRLRIDLFETRQDSKETDYFTLLPSLGKILRTRGDDEHLTEKILSDSEAHFKFKDRNHLDNIVS